MVAALALLCLSACTTDRWRHEEWVPYGRDLEVGRNDLEQLAASSCPVPDLLTPRFASDGCTAAPEGKVGGCCVQHDLAYWCGGTREARKAADLELRNCVRTQGHTVLAWSMYWSVRLAGHPVWPFRWRWGYGRRWRAGYWKRPESPIPGQPPAAWHAGVPISKPSPIGLLSVAHKDAPTRSFEKNEE